MRKHIIVQKLEHVKDIVHQTFKSIFERLKVFWLSFDIFWPCTDWYGSQISVCENQKCWALLSTHCLAYDDGAYFRTLKANFLF